MRIAIIGPGRVGTLLATAATRAGHRVVAVGGGRPASRSRLIATVAGARPHDTPAEAARAAELILVCVPDDQLETVLTQLVVADALGPGQRVVHVAGAHGRAVLARAARTGAGVAACHPAMTIPLGSVDPELLHGVAWAVTAVGADRAWVHAFVADLGGDPRDVPEDRRVLYHAALAVGANAVGAAVATARHLLLAASIEDPGPFLRPLAHASVDAIADRGAAALTGPVARGDVATIAAHRAAIETDVPVLSEAYRLHARATLEPLRAQLDPATAAALAALLAPDTDSRTGTDGGVEPVGEPGGGPGRDPEEQ